MRFRRLELAAFGHFNDTILDLSQGAQGLHLVLGPNEAGKSTALRAIHDLFFGIPARTTDSFLHAPSKLLIKALLELKNGDAIFCQRRKGNKNTLLDQEGSPLSPKETARFLELVPESTFKSIFSTSHEELRKGGELIATGQGDLGQALFAAGTGGLGMRNLIQELEDQAGAIFKPTNAKKPLLNNLLIQYQSQMTLARKTILKPEEYEEQLAIQNQAQKRLDHLKTEIRDLSSRLNQLDRIEKTQPLVAALGQAEQDLKALPKAAKLDTEFSGSRREAQKEIKEAKSQKAALVAEIESLKQRLSGLLPDKAVLEKTRTVESLFSDLGKYQQNLSDLPGQDTLLKEKKHQAEKLYRELGLKPEDTEEEPALPSVSQRTRLQELSEEEQALKNNLTNAQNRARELTTEHARLKERQKNLPSGLELVYPLAMAVGRAREQGDLDTAIAEMQNQVIELEQRLNQSVIDLPFFKGSLEELLTFNAPYEETAAEHEALMAENRRRKDSLKQGREQLFSELNDLKAEIESLTIHGSAPTMEELTKARQKRDQGWQLIKKSWLMHSPDPEAEARFKGSLSLDLAYEASVKKADQTADRIFEQSETVTRLEDRKARQKNCLERLNEINLKIKAQEEEAMTAWQKWANLWTPLMPEPGAPNEMQRWLRDFKEIKQLSLDREKAKQKLARIQKTKGTYQAELTGILSQIQGPLLSSGLDWQALLKMAEGLHASLIKAGQDQKNAEERISEVNEQLKQANSEQAEHKEALDLWQENWERALDQAGMNSGLTPRQAMAELNTRTELSQTLAKANSARQTIAALRQKISTYQKQVQDLCTAIAPRLSDQKTEEAVEGLNRLLADTKTAQTQKEALSEQLQDKETSLNGIEARLNQAKEVLAKLLIQAGVEKEENLPLAEDIWLKREAKLREINELTQSLLSHASPGMGAGELREEAAQVKADELFALKAETQQQLDNLEEQRAGEQEKTAQAKLRLEQMNDQKGAAQARQEADNLLAEARDKTEEYLKILFAVNLLKMQMERYLKENKKPLLDKAGEYFRELTGGSFSGLAMGYDEKDNPILLGIRSGKNKEQLPVGAMSDGTCDQLYLGLRLAALELHLAAREPFPFIMDDALVHFDDQRAARALSALTRLSAQTQVIFFTHHQHLGELAGQVAKDGELFIHRLEA